MQKFKSRFRQPDGSKDGSLQSCIRTNDLDLVGDGSHLTYFEMLGNFSFGGADYETSVEMWHVIMGDLGVEPSHVTVHPSQDVHRSMWESRGYAVKPDGSCEWTDGEVGGFCCEIFVGELEVGNLVNPLGHSTDVGFGWERLYQVIENKGRVDETSLFRQGVSPIVSDHMRSLLVMRENGIRPGGKGRDHVCRRLVRRLLDESVPSSELDEWIEVERLLRTDRLKTARRHLRKFRDRDEKFWLDTFGIMPDEIKML